MNPKHRCLRSIADVAGIFHHMDLSGSWWVVPGTLDVELCRLSVSEMLGTNASLIGLMHLVRAGLFGSAVVAHTGEPVFNSLDFDHRLEVKGRLNPNVTDRFPVRELRHGMELEASRAPLRRLPGGSAAAAAAPSLSDRITRPPTTPSSSLAPLCPVRGRSTSSLPKSMSRLHPYPRRGPRG